MKYTKKEPVYSGPMCDVYKGEDSQGNPVALKVVDLDFVRKPHNFRQEVRLVRKLQHPGVSRFLDSYSVGDDQVLVMPYYAVDMPGVMAHFCKKRVKFNLADPLANQTVEKNEIPLGQVAPMVASLLETLSYIHSQNVIHRDLKPANIMFKSLDHLAHPIIGDFGISYDLSIANPDEPPHEKVTDIGTGYYKAPELCFGVSDYGPEVDMWSLGVIVSYLYSSNCHPCNWVEPVAGESELHPELNDFVLIQGVFGAFGTPSVTDPHSELYWPKLADPKYHFVKFQYKVVERKPTARLLPRCTDEEIYDVFDHLTRYDQRQLVMPSSLEKAKSG